MKTDSTCVMDFCGSYSGKGYSIYPFQYWADYFPSESITRFGGRLQDIPNMPCDTEPSETQLEKWIKKHGGFYFTPEESDILKH